MTKRLATTIAIALASTSVFAQAAMAQTTPQDAQSADPAEPASPQAATLDADDPAASEAVAEGEGIVVTGSRIRGVAPVGSNVISVGGDQISRQPTATITEFLRKVPQVQGFGVDASSPTVSGQGGTNTTRGSSINLRGLGPGATLTLLDGSRLPNSGVSGNYVDPNAIPSIGIERIEVVADGASAIYGSDAVAGVVNFITRKDYDGLLMRGRYGFADGYWVAQFGGVMGHRWGSGGYAVSYEHSENGNLNGGERDYIRSDLRDFGGSDYRNSQCNPGNIVVGGVAYAIPANGVTPATASTLQPNTRNFCENVRFTDVLPAENRDRLIFNAHQELLPGLTLTGQILYSHRTYNAKALQQGSTSNLVNLSVPNTNPFFVRPVGSTATSVTVEYDFTKEFGLIEQFGLTKTQRYALGLEWAIAPGWEINLGGFIGKDFSEQTTPRVDNTALTAALRSTNPALAFNPFGGTNSQAVRDSIFVGIFNPYAYNTTKGAEANVSGSLFEIGGGAVRLAVGAEYVRYTIGGGSAIGNINNPSTLFQFQERNQKSVYGELFVPIFGPGNATGGFERLDISVAGRIDKYSDVGTTRNPKIGVNWSPFNGLLLKGSYGTSFRAPNLQDLPLLRTGAGLAVVTWIDPQSPSGSSVGLSLNAGNPDLTPESATTWSGTIEWKPPSIPGLIASATYFSIDYKDVIGFPPRTANSLLDPNYAFVVTRNPSNQLIQSYLDQGFTIAGVRPPSPAFFYNGQARNLGSIQNDGIDFNMSYDTTASFGQLTFGLSGTYLLNYDVAITQISPSIEQLDFINYPVDFRARASAGWSNAGASAEVTLNYLDSYNNNLVTPVQTVDAFATVDLHLGYDFGAGSGVFNELSVSLDANNVFDQRAPFVNIQNGFDAGQASALGRFIAFTVAKKF